jgi:hypothetical protein
MGRIAAGSLTAMANVIFYSTGEIFWVSDPPPGKPHIGIPHIFPPVPPDHLFTYARSAHALTEAGHTVVGAYGRQRRAVRDAFASGDFPGDREILALESLRDPARTVLVLIATETNTRANGGVDEYERIPFTEGERAAFNAFRRAGGGVYVTWDHGPLGYRTLAELGIEGPVRPEPPDAYRPNVHWSYDSTDQAKIDVRGRKLNPGGPSQPATVSLSIGPPAGFLQKIVPATLIYKDANGQPAPLPPHQVFNGVGGGDGIWIPAHMHEGKLKADVTLQTLDERELPQGVRILAVHVPFTETTFDSFAVMAIKERVRTPDTGAVVEGAVLWDTSFHHLVDINWSSDGKVDWDPFVPFSAQALWQQQFPKELFEQRLQRGMKRLFVNIVKWLADELPPSPREQQLRLAAGSAGFAASADASEYQQLTEHQAQPSADLDFWGR